ncbi:MAG TPA: hypothetical protein VF587_09520 [Solirubrobacteraceae bacterium]
MIPLHLRHTTIIVSAEHAETLVSRGLAEWIPGGQGLVASSRENDAVLEAIGERPAAAA